MTDDEAKMRDRENAIYESCAAHVLALEQTNVQLLRWQSVASDAHVDHLCALIRSLAVSDETPRTLRDLSAMGVEEEVRRIVAAERINREKSEATAREWRKKAENAEAAQADAHAIVAAAKNLCELLATRDPQFLSGLEEDLMRACGIASRFSREK